MAEKIQYFKAPWPEFPTPDDMPVWSYYEVAVERDFVMRIVEIFKDGVKNRDSVKLAEREGPDYRAPEHRSLVQGPFLSTMPGSLTPISKLCFEETWNNAVDKPWPETN